MEKEATREREIGTVNTSDGKFVIGLHSSLNSQHSDKGIIELS